MTLRCDSKLRSFMEFWKTILSSPLPTRVLTARARTQTRAREVELGAQRPAQVWFQPMVTRHPQPLVQSAFALRPHPFSSVPSAPPLRFPFGSTELDRAESPFGRRRAGCHWRKICYRKTQSERAQKRISGCDWLARSLPSPPPFLPPRGRFGGGASGGGPR